MNQESINPWSEFDSFKKELERKDEVVINIWKKMIQLFAYHHCLGLKPEDIILELDEVTQDWLKYHNEKFTILQYISINNIPFILDKDILFFVRSEFHTNLEKLFDDNSSKINEFNPAIKDYLIELRDKNKSEFLKELLNGWINEIKDSKNYYYKTELFSVRKETELEIPYILNEILERHRPLMLKLNFKMLNEKTDLFDKLVKLNSVAIKTIVNEKTIELIISEKSEYYLIPIINTNLLENELSDCEVSLKTNGTKLILEIKNGKEKKSKEYDEPTESILPPSLHLWPNKNWVINYFASKTTTKYVWEAGHRLKKTDQIYFGKNTNLNFNYCVLSEKNRHLGIIKLNSKLFDHITPESINYDVVIDFGTSNTVVFFRQGVNLQKINFEECGSMSEFGNPINEFISENPDIPQGGFSSLLFQNDDNFEWKASSDITCVVPSEFNIVFNSDFQILNNLDGPRIKSNFKWKSGVPEGKTEISAFIYSLLLLICLKLNSFTQKLSLYLTFPSSFSLSDTGFYRGQLKEIVKIVDNLTGLDINLTEGNGNDWLVRESVAGAAYLTSKSDNNIVGIDIGGGTADFCLLENKQLKKEYSMKFAGGDIIDVFSNSENLFNDIIKYFAIDQKFKTDDKSLFYTLLLKKEFNRLLEYFKMNFNSHHDIKKIRTAILILLYSYCKFISIFIDDYRKNSLLSIYFMGNGSKFLEFLTLNNEVLKNTLNRIIKGWIGLNGGLNINLPNAEIKEEVVKGAFVLIDMEPGNRSNFNNATTYQYHENNENDLFNLKEINDACKELQLLDMDKIDLTINAEGVNDHPMITKSKSLIKLLI